MGLPWQSRVQPLRFHGWGAVPSLDGELRPHVPVCTVRETQSPVKIRKSEVYETATLDMGQNLTPRHPAQPHSHHSHKNFIYKTGG